MISSVTNIVGTVPFYHISNYIFNLLIPPMRRKKLPWLKSFSDVLNFLGLLNVANFSLIGLPSGRASRGRFWSRVKRKKNWWEKCCSLITLIQWLIDMGKNERTNDGAHYKHEYALIIFIIWNNDQYVLIYS